MSKIIIIGGRIHSIEVGNVTTGANEVLDDTKGKKQNVINSETDAELLRLDQSKQNNLTFDSTPTENSNNPVKSSGVYAADKALSEAIEAILLLIPSAATSLNQLADKAFVNSSVSTATATFRGTYNVVTDLELAYDAIHEQIATKLGQVIATADNNDYAFVQVPVSATSTDIRRTERYKFNGTVWGYEYDLNTSGFTQAQWEAINSAITAALVQKLAALPTAQELATALAGKQATLTFDNVPKTDSSNPVKSGGVKSAINDEKVARENADTGLGNRITAIENVIPSAASSSNKLVDNAAMTAAISEVTALIGQMDATFNLTTTDGHITLHVTQVDGVITSVQVQSSDIASAAALTLVTNRVTTAEGDITSLTGRVSTNETDIAQLQDAYEALTQSDIIIGALPASGVANKIYRVPGTSSYSDYMWNGSSWVLMATYSNQPVSTEIYRHILGNVNSFDQLYIRDHMCINSTSPYAIVPFINGHIVITDFLRIPDNCQSISYSGLTVGAGLRFRLGMSPVDNDTETYAEEFSQASGTIKITTELRKYKWLVLTVYRSGDYSDTPDLSNVQIVFDTWSNKDLESASLCNGQVFFDKGYIRKGKSINSVSPYQILDYTSQTSILTGFYKIDDDCVSISYSGLTIGDGIRFRFSKEPTDTGDAIAINVTESSGTMDIQYLMDYKYVTFWIYRNADTSVEPDLSNIFIKFNRASRLKTLYNFMYRGFDPNMNMFNLMQVREKNKVINSTYPYDIVNLGITGTVYITNFYLLTNVSSISYSGLTVGDGLRARFSKSPEDAVSDAISLEITSSSGTIQLTPMMKDYPYFCMGVYRSNIDEIPSFAGITINFNIDASDSESKNYTSLIKALNGKVTPAIQPRKGTVMFVMDCGDSFYNQNSMTYDELLMSHGFDNTTYALLPESLQNNTKKAFIKNFADLGREICIHSDSRISQATTSALYEELLQTYFSEMFEAGIMPSAGYISLSGANVPDLTVLKKYCGWGQTGPANTDIKSEDYMDAVDGLSTDPCHLNRLAIEQTPEDHISETTTLIVNRAKQVIDSVIANKGYVIFYTHSYMVTAASYTLYDDVLIPILDYIKQKHDAGLLCTGSVEDALNWYYAKRFNEE